MTVVAEIEVKRGAITRHWLPVSDVPGAPRLPLILVGGAKSGPTMLVTSGIHGDEYDGFEAALRLTESVVPEDLAGVLAVIPRVNVRAFDQGRRWSNLDGLDLNRQFPGHKGGFMAQRLAWFLTNVVLKGVDMVLDFHGGTSELEVCSYGSVVAPPPVAEELKPLLAVSHLWDWSETVGMRGTFMDMAEAAGIPFAIVEIGGNNTWREGPVTDGVNAGRNLMRYLKMIDGAYEGIPAKQYTLRGSFIHAEADGFLRPKVGLGARVEEGQLLAEVFDLLGQKLYDVRSEVTGIVNDIRTHPSVHCGEWLYLVGRVVETHEIDSAGLTRRG